ncbi:hypothetical protein [Methylomonas rapida]|jgi:hypothetical protein|uniref:Low-complexity protein n=1 Tax=Methylomonas rapida TaxID=2963939 RepID=A0ABY7GM27_9GAMM|nr:hypothetical protein [Methylomonas rapida]WAR45563.1 hypothetical protein NM686_003340 [Methylomonas rapida]
MKKIQKTPFAIAMSASLLPFAANAVETQANPFALSELDSGYMQTAEAEKPADSKMKDGACGEGKCGGAMMQKSTDSKAVEGKCAGNKPAPAPAGDKAGSDKKMEGNCGANMK